MRVVVLDNYDSFTWNLVQGLSAQGAECLVHRADEITVGEIRGLGPSGMVLSPGPFGPERTGVCIEAVRELARSIPILGVCLGMQVIAVVGGARVVGSGRPCHGKARQVRHDGRGFLRGLPDPLTAGLYHSLVVDPASVPRALEVSATGPGGTVMGVRLAQTRAEGVLFHPESFLTPDGERILNNFLEAARVV